MVAAAFEEDRLETERAGLFPELVRHLRVRLHGGSNHWLVDIVNEKGTIHVGAVLFIGTQPFQNEGIAVAGLFLQYLSRILRNVGGQPGVVVVAA